MTTAISAGSAATGLPAEPNSFIGRERDLADLAMLLADVRMLTLSGPGGIGKTRLAGRLAGRLAAEFADGAWLVEFADTIDPALVWLRVAATLGIREEPDRPVHDTLIDALRQRRLLLVLDTCEHVIEALAELAHRLLTECPGLRIVATSREPLRVRGETVWRVPPLGLPAVSSAADLADLADHEAIRLFLDRAAAVRPGYALTNANADAVSRVCRTLDGMPLAIELAAARMRALSAEQVADRLDDRFRLLASGDRTAPPRQQTLQAAVDWSHSLLTVGEQLLLRRLAVFAGWNLDMAEQVCADDQVSAADVLDLLAGLIDKSLVTLDGEVDGVARYRLLDTIRQYAANRLAASGEEQVIRLRHLDLMLTDAEYSNAVGFGRGDPPWAERVAIFWRFEREMPNFRAALTTALQANRIEHGLRLCSALRPWWVVYGDVTEGTIWFDRFLRHHAEAEGGPGGLPPGEPSPAVRAKALTLRTELAFEQQDYTGAETAAKAALEVCQEADEPVSPGALRLLGVVSLRAGQPDRALANIEAAIEAARASGDDWEEGLGLTARATTLARLGRLDEAEDAYAVALLTLSDNNRWGYAHALYGSGSLARARGDRDMALQNFRTALELFAAIDARTEIARCEAGIGWVSLAAGDLTTAAASFRHSLQLSVATGQRLGVARGLSAIAALALATGEPAVAVRLESAATTLRDQVGPLRSASAQVRLDQALAQVRRNGTDDADRLLADGARLRAEEAVSSAIALASSVTDSGGPVPAAANGDSVTAAGLAPRAIPRPRAGAEAAHGAPALTAREMQIAYLIARGLSNRAIATELVISPATAARHVANIFTKLGVTSRAQVAAWTAAHPLPH